MVVLDTNIFVYIANKTLSGETVAGVDIAFATVSKVEALGYMDILAFEERLLRELFEEAAALPLTDSVVEQAILLRQQRKIGLGDAIIAATALEHGYELWTANVKDFRNIGGLKLRNPLEA